jgi:hypothetical protein
MSTIETVEQHSAVSWQECNQCGGVFMVWADPHAPPIDSRYNTDEIEASWFRYRDGSTPLRGEIIRCSDCHGFDYASLLPIARRWGPELPPVPPRAQWGIPAISL